MSQETDASLKAAIAQQLERVGFVVTPVPLPPCGRAPDFIAEKAGDQYIFELKERVDDPDILATENARLDAGEIVPHAESTGRSERVAEKARDGVKQLQAHKSAESAFHLLWLHAGGRDPEVQVEQFRSTLYGITNIVDLRVSHTTRCYYFGHSEFFRGRGLLAGAVITTPTRLQVCINTLSPRVSEFRKSALVETFKNGLLDPDFLEREGNAFVADCDADRNDEPAVLTYLQAKYGRTRLMSMNLGKMTARTVEQMEPNGTAGQEGDI